MPANISVRIQPKDYPSEFDVVICMNLDKELVRKTFVPLDFPDKDADVFTRMICDSQCKIAEVTASRKEIAEAITEKIVEMIVAAMGKQDTKNGYKKDKL